MTNIITGQAIILVGSAVMTKQGPGKVTALGESYIEVELETKQVVQLPPSHIEFVVLERSASNIPATTPAPIYSQAERDAGFAKYHPLHEQNNCGLKTIQLQQPAFLPSTNCAAGTFVSGLPTIPIAFKEPAPYAEATILISSPSHISGGASPAPPHHN